VSATTAGPLAPAGVAVGANRHPLQLVARSHRRRLQRRCRSGRRKGGAAIAALRVRGFLVGRRIAHRTAHPPAWPPVNRHRVDAHRHARLACRALADASPLALATAPSSSLRSSSLTSSRATRASASRRICVAASAWSRV